MILGRIVCFFKGHRRGKFDRRVTPDDGASIWSIFACPRCGRETRYKVRPNGQTVGEPTDGSPSISVAQATAEYLAKRKL